MVVGGSDGLGIENVVIDEKFFVAFHDYSTLANERSQRTLLQNRNTPRKSFTIEIERV